MSENKSDSNHSACDHTQPSDIATMAEKYLLDKGIPKSSWEYCRFGFGGTGGSGPFKSVYTEVEYRKGNWVAVKLDRLKTDLPPEKIGFQTVSLPYLKV